MLPMYCAVPALAAHMLAHFFCQAGGQVDLLVLVPWLSQQALAAVAQEQAAAEQAQAAIEKARAAVEPARAAVEQAQAVVESAPWLSQQA